MSVVDVDRMSVFDPIQNLADIQFVSFDVETTGLSPQADRLVELSGVKFKLCEDSCSTFSELINPEREIPSEASAVHGITMAMVKDAPAVASVIPEFLSWVGDDRTVLVAHNAPFDVGFLRSAIRRLQIPMPSHHVIDTLTLSRRLLPDAPNHQLRTLIEHLKLDSGGYHRALADSHHVRNMLQRFVEGKSRLQTWGEVLERSCVFRFDQEGELAPYISPAVKLAVASIKDAIERSLQISFVYNGFKARERTVKPISVVQNRGNHYLTAYCYQAEEERTFRVDKISRLKTLE